MKCHTPRPKASAAATLKAVLTKASRYGCSGWKMPTSVAAGARFLPLSGGGDLGEEAASAVVVVVVVGNAEGSPRLCRPTPWLPRVLGRPAATRRDDGGHDGRIRNAWVPAGRSRSRSRSREARRRPAPAATAAVAPAAADRRRGRAILPGLGLGLLLLLLLLLLPSILPACLRWVWMRI